MSGSARDDKSPGEVREQARHGLEQADAGNAAGVEQIDDAMAVDPTETEAAEQEAADGPEGRGLSR
jgi:hypothetical protein